MTTEPAVLGIILSTALTLVAVGVAWGSLKQELRGINKQLERMNGSLDEHRTRITSHGERLARIEGEREA